jgi:hypothetical protein
MPAAINVNESPIVEINWAVHMRVKPGLRNTENGETWRVATGVLI